MFETVPPLLELISGGGSTGLLALGGYYLFLENKRKDKKIDELRDRETERMAADLALFRTAAMKAVKDVE